MEKKERNKQSIDEAAQAYAYKTNKDKFSRIPNKEYQAFKAGSDYQAKQQPVSADILGLHNAWPLLDVLKKLTESTRYLLEVKNYDRHGWEDVSHCVKRGEEIIKLLESGKEQQPDKTLDECKELIAELDEILDGMWDRSLDRHEVNDFVSSIGNVKDRILEPYTSSKAAETQQGWIDVNDGLPKLDSDVWIYSPSYGVESAFYWNYRGKQVFHSGDEAYNPTHWMYYVAPLPPHPNE